MTELSWINGVETGLVPANNRGLAYGDGLFETIAVRGGRCQLLDLHLQRLLLGCQKLAMQLDVEKLQAELLAFTALCNDCFDADAVIKIIVCRQASGRGYAGDPSAASIRILSGFALPPLDPALVQHGVPLRFCTTPVSVNPALAGMKHLCRLDSVLARSEWVNDQPNGVYFFDGLMLDDRQRVIEGTMTNVFLIKGGTLMTPSLERSGVSGVMRQWLMTVLAAKAGLSISVTELTKADLLDADELFVCNSVQMIVPVRQLADHSWTAWPKTAQLQRLAEELIFA